MSSVPDRCGVCQARDSRHDATMIDRSGGAFTRLCDSCLGWLIRRDAESVDDQCAICYGHAPADRRADELIDQRTPPTVAATICDDCRRAVLVQSAAARTGEEPEVEA